MPDDTRVLGFDLIEDIALGQGKRWVLVRPSGAGETGLLLAEARTPVQQKCVGDQTCGRVFSFLHTDDFWRDNRSFQERGAKFHGQPRVEAYGTVAVFSDLYGNKWDLLQLNVR